MKEKIILASKSPRREYILKLIGFNPIVKVSNCDESKIKETSPQKLVKILSRLKAQTVVQECEKGDVIVAADTVVSIDGIILGKPKDKKDADKMLKEIAGRDHVVYTGVTVAKIGEKKTKYKTFCEKTVVTIDELSQKEIDEYIASGEPMDKAGAYGIQGLFAKHVPKIKGDFFTVMGLPASRVYKTIKEIEEEDL